METVTRKEAKDARGERALFDSEKTRIVALVGATAAGRGSGYRERGVPLVDPPDPWLKT